MISIGKIFGLFEQNKKQLSIQNYSVKQATIEQIFNMFAENKITLAKKPMQEGENLTDEIHFGQAVPIQNCTNTGKQSPQNTGDPGKFNNGGSRDEPCSKPDHIEIPVR